MEKHTLPKRRVATPPPGSSGEYSRGSGLRLAMLREKETLVIRVEIPGRKALEIAHRAERDVGHGWGRALRKSANADEN